MLILLAKVRSELKLRMSMLSVTCESTFSRSAIVIGETVVVGETEVDYCMIAMPCAARSHKPREVGKHYVFFKN